MRIAVSLAVTLGLATVAALPARAVDICEAVGQSDPRHGAGLHTGCDAYLLADASGMEDDAPSAGHGMDKTWMRFSLAAHPGEPAADEAPNGHYFAWDVDDAVNAIAAGFKPEGAAGYVAAPLDDLGHCASGLLPLWRLEAPDFAGFLWTVDPVERAAAILVRDFFDDGVVACVAPPEAEGYVTVYRLRRPDDVAPFYTTDQTEGEQMALNRGYVYDGPAFAISALPQ